MITPCIGVCSLREGYCIGCKRSKEEIVGWSTYSDIVRVEIMEKLDTRD